MRSAQSTYRPTRLCRFWVLIAFKDEVLGLVLSAPEVPDDTAIVTGPLSAVASAAFTAAGVLSVLNSFGVNLEPVRAPLTFCHPGTYLGICYANRRNAGDQNQQ